MLDVFGMHDWTLLSVAFAWEDARATLTFLSHSSRHALVATQVRDLHIPRRDDWGRSVSVNATNLIDAADGLRTLQIEMQSGDTISLTAAAFALEAV